MLIGRKFLSSEEFKKNTSANDKVVLHTLALFASSKDNCDLSYSQLCELTSLTRSTVSKALKNLERLEYIASSKIFHKNNVYTISSSCKEQYNAQPAQIFPDPPSSQKYPFPAL